MRRRRRRAPIDGFAGAQMRAARLRLGKTIAQIADEAGVNERSYGAWERDEVVPTVAAIRPLVDYLRDNGIDAYAFASADPLDPLKQAILDNRVLTEDQKKEAIAFIDSMQQRDHHPTRQQR